MLRRHHGQKDEPDAAFIVAVNMMGSGIIMLPANMAQVSAISLLSWIVTALGSMAIAYELAQAGLFVSGPAACRPMPRMPTAGQLFPRLLPVFPVIGDR